MQMCGLGWGAKSVKHHVKVDNVQMCGPGGGAKYVKSIVNVQMSRPGGQRAFNGVGEGAIRVLLSPVIFPSHC